MAVTPLACFAGYPSSSQATSFTISSLDSGAGTNRLAVLAVRVYDANTSTLGTPKWGGSSGQSFTSILKKDFGSAQDDLHFFYLVNPTAGVKDLYIPFSVGDDRIQYSLVFYEDIMQLGTLDTYTSDNTSGTSVQLTLNPTENSLFVIALAHNQGATSAGDNTTERCENNDNGTIWLGDSNAFSDSSLALNASWSGVSDNACIMVCFVKYNLWRNTTKNSANWSNQDRNTATYTNLNKS